jgi:hypothetical protein
VDFAAIAPLREGRHSGRELVERVGFELTARQIQMYGAKAA